MDNKETKRWTKKHLISLLSIILVFIVTAITAVAVLSNIEDKSNVFTVGSQTIEISEDKFEISSDDVIKPDVPFYKNPTIKNTGTTSCYIRAYIGFSDHSLIDNTTININDDWVLGEDGYYYYTSSVKPGKSVELFDKITVSNTNHYKCNIFIQADSIDANDLSYEKAWHDAFGIMPPA